MIMNQKMIVELVPHSPDWNDQYSIEEQSILNTLREYLESIDHVGSTVVPTITAKPIIDILVTVKSFENIEIVSSLLENIEYVSKGVLDENGGRFFVKYHQDKRKFFLHVFEQTNPIAKQFVIFRDKLCEDLSLAKEYESLKIELANTYRSDIDSYRKLKKSFIERHS